ncbi:polysaccharide biosynthesis tyrosine autokinase [Aestuariimicrobium soli]|uniref:polysaccharide biosynthesis tyrosine autokinase n=1 Tax=Aestuariimicrobium soli TaxID=2035834 RepID=UPI003EBAC24B
MTLLDIVRLLRRNALILLAFMLVGAGLGAAWTYTRPTVYASQAVGLVVAGDTATVVGATSGDLLAQQRAAAYTNLMTTGPVLQRVNAEVSKKGLPVGGFWATSVPGTAFIRVHASASTPQSAQATANAALAALVAEALRMETYGQVQTMETPPPDGQLRKLTAIHVLPYEQAGLPGAPARVGLVRNLALGAVAGFLAGLALVVVRRKLDVKVRTQSDVESLTGHSVLGLLPDSKEVRRQRNAGVGSLAGLPGESLRKLRTNLRFVHVDDPVHSLVVTSANPGEGKSTVASNLARVMALSGQSVVLLDCDLRRPVQGKAFGIDSSVGLTQVLAGDISVDEALVETKVTGLRVLPAGRVPPNPSELVGSRKMSELIASLSKDHLVVIDAPPMLAVTDAALLARASGGALFVASAGRTPKDQLANCAKQLDLVGATLLGTVLNRVPRRGISEAMYGYATGGYISKQEKYYTSATVESETVVIPESPMPVGRASAKHTPAHRPSQAARARRGVVSDDTLHG